jgi:D-amino-acid oxidase
MAPEIAPPEIVAQRKPTIDDIRPLIIEEGCGLRPGRTAVFGWRVPHYLARTVSSVPVVFNYG